MSRFARDQSLAHQSARRLAKAGVSLFDAMTDVDYTVERTWFGINAAFAEHTSEVQSKKIKSAKDERFELGLHNGDVPFGYRRQESTRAPLLPVPAEAEAVREVFRMRAANVGYLDIARWLNGQGCEPHSKVGHKRFGTESVRVMIQNPFYYGLVRHRDKMRLGAHEPIVPEREWLSAQPSVRRHTARNSRKSVRAILTGIVSCASCGHSLHVTHGARSAYYRERSSAMSRTCEADGTSWKAAVPDGTVEALLIDMITDRDWHELVGAIWVTPGVSDPRRKLERKRKRIRNLVVEELIDEIEGHELLADANRQLAGLPADIAPLKPALERLRSFGESWGLASAEQRNRLCKEMFSEVMLDTRTKDESEILIRPHAELSPLFDARCEHVLAVVGPAGLEHRSANNLTSFCLRDLRTA